jgi:hypothetical protein
MLASSRQLSGNIAGRRAVRAEERHLWRPVLRSLGEATSRLLARIAQPAAAFAGLPSNGRTEVDALAEGYACIAIS